MDRRLYADFIKSENLPDFSQLEQSPPLFHKALKFKLLLKDMKRVLVSMYPVLGVEPVPGSAPLL